MFKRHPVYLVSHIIIGFIGYFYPEVLYATLGYQVLQYALGIRFFLFEGDIKTGNSIEHTTKKLAEVAVGYVIAMLYKALSTA
jgi:hypothetical protein